MGSQQRVTSRAREALFFVIVLNVAVQALLVDRGVTTGYGLGNGFVIELVNLPVFANDTRIRVGR